MVWLGCGSDYIAALQYIVKMSTEVSLTITKILNWTRTEGNARVEVAFYGLQTGAYLAHKTALGYYSHQSLLLNTSFKINFTTAEHVLNCKISLLQDNQAPELVGSIEIDLNLLLQRSLIFVPFQDHDKVLEIKLYQPKKDRQEVANDEVLKQQREDFLQQRFDFIDKINNHEAELKKKFSEKVYGFLRELKSRNGHSDSEGKKHQEAREPRKNELDFRTRFNEERKRVDTKKLDIFTHPEQPNYRVSPAKQKVDQELLIHSLNHRKQSKGEGRPDRQDWEMGPLLNNKEERYTPREDRYYTGSEKGEGWKSNADFGGVLNNPI